MSSRSSTSSLKEPYSSTILSAISSRITEVRESVRRPSGLMMLSGLRSGYPRIAATFCGERSVVFGASRSCRRMRCAFSGEESAA